VIEVHREGDPIPPEALPTLFDPYARVRPEGEKSSDATLGVGLYIAHQIVLAHGGRIDVSSNAADGTTFRVVLPRAGA
jgi:signal transduction histidine kinase